MENEKLYSVIQEAVTRLEPVYGEQITQAIQDTGLEPPAWFTLIRINGLSEPVKLSDLQALNPFGRIERLEDLIQASLEKSYVEAQPGSEGYILTQAGRKAASQPFKLVHKLLDQTEPMETGQLERLAGLLQKIVQATLEADRPTAKLNLTRSRVTDPGPKAGPVTRIDQYLTDLIFYRDDAHNAAWQPHGSSAEAWDVVTAVWREQADDLDSMVEQFQARGYTQESLLRVIEEANQLGWLTASDDKLALTPAGSDLRQTTEDLTNEYYFGPWSTLTESELQEFEDLLTAFVTALSPEEETT